MNDGSGGDISKRIVFEDNHLLVIDKPAGLLSQGDKTGDSNVVDLLKAYRISAEGKPGEAFVGLVHRLDRPVSGVMALAKTSKAARRLTDSWHTNAVTKIYRAVVTGDERAIALFRESGQGEWIDRLVKDESTNTVRVVEPGRGAGDASREARLSCRLVRQEGKLAEAEIRLGTGRGHQIRVQLAHRGLVIVGDSKYGSKAKYTDQIGHPRIALHALRLVLPHPTLKRRLALTAAMPPGWPMGRDERYPTEAHWLDEALGD
jgi:23S rRNA pseudouridine1911/1915/1917 synthase